MKKKPKKTQNKRKKIILRQTAFSNLEKNLIQLLQRFINGYLNMLPIEWQEEFFTAGIPTILGMSVFVVSYYRYKKYC